MCAWTPTSALAQAVWAAGFEYDPAQDIIFSRMDPLQRNFGYAYGYDVLALAMSADIDCEPIFFDYAGKHWMIELWKGQYGLETGCEIGVYTRPIGFTNPVYALLDSTIGQRPGDATASHNLFYDCASNADRLTLKSTLRRNGTTLFTRGAEVHWWLTGFKWGVNSDPAQLEMDVEITLKDTAMRDAFLGGIAGRNYTNQTVNGTTVSFTFDQPKAVPQPPKPAALLTQIRDDNQVIVDAYNALGFPSNDPNVVQAEFLNVVGLAMLHVADFYGMAASQLAIEIGKDISSIVTALTDAFGVAASEVEEWLNGASQAFATWVADIEKYLNLPLDFSCYVEIDNTKGQSDLLLTGQTADSGSFKAGPPSWIPRGMTGRLVLQDPKPSIFGSKGSATYRYADTNLTMRTVVFAFECPTGFDPNKASSSRAEWKCFAKSSDRNNAWSTTVPGGGHPLFVDYVTAGGQPRQPGGERLVTQSRRAVGGKVLALCHPGESWSPRSVADAIADIRRGDYSYVAVDPAGHRSSISVVRGRHGAYLRTRPDTTAANNLDELPPC
jgi:hypothetical protein